jgi:hypothetical protein
LAGRVPAGSCQIAYTFIIGANPNGTTDFVDTDINGTLTTVPLGGSAMEEDLTYLNVRENMNEGKMQSWFKYATSLDVPFDYVAKVDSDTMLFPPRFLSFCEEYLPQHPLKQRVYGGNPVDRKECGKNWWCKNRMQGKTYMAGGLYFLSANLAKYIVSPELNRTDLLAPREDVAIGNLVYSSPYPVMTSTILKRHKLWEHGRNLKFRKRYRKGWAQVKDNWLEEGNTFEATKPDGMAVSNNETSEVDVEGSEGSANGRGSGNSTS